MIGITMKNIIDNIWPMVLIMTIILSTLIKSYIIKNKLKFCFYEEMFKLAFMIYVIGLFYLVTFQDVSWSTSNFIPFKEIFRYNIFSAMFFKNVIGNMIIFIPYGFFISYFLKLDKSKQVIFLSLITSITIEITQLIIGRVFDVDDILLNVLGGIVGYLLYKLLRKFKDRLPWICKTEMFYNIVVFIVSMAIGYYVYYVLGGFNV